MNNEYNNKSERIIRTNVVYYDKCPNCGAPREHDEETCPYCQQSLIKSKEVIKEVEVEKETPTIVNNINNSNVINNYRKKCNKWVSFFLCLFLGYFGVHKFYEGKVGLGILYLFTCGLFGIGWFIDCIILLCKPNPYYVIDKHKNQTVNYQYVNSNN